MIVELPSPPAGPVWWVAVYGDSTCHVFTKTWFDARAVACAELGCEQDQCVPSLSEVPNA